MKMVKSLLLGSAAGVVAVTMGQAADLPVKAKPVEYVKICSLYGAGFYYMPGTDLCIKVGGWVRAEETYGGNGNMTWGPYNANLNQRATSNDFFRARGYITADVRNQTEYGTVRGYIAVGLNTNDVGLQVTSLVDSANRAYVQWAGMTAGLAVSFFDFYNVPIVQYRGGYLPASDTGDGGWFVWAYTAQFGGGFSATLSSEARRTTQIIDQNAINGTAGAASGNVYATSAGSIVPGSYFNALTGGFPTTAAGSTVLPSGAAALLPGAGAYGGMQMPDIVGNLRVDQAWGAAQVMGALHEVNASYYSCTATGSTNVLGGHPGDAWGWAVGGGLKINMPMFGGGGSTFLGSGGDFFQTQVNYTQGALRYLFNTPNTNWGANNGSQEAYGVLSDCVYGGTVAAGTNTSCQLTTAWGFNASYEHYWVPAWHTSLYGAYYVVQYNALANNMLCSVANVQSSAIPGSAGSLAAGALGTGSAGAAGCNNNWSMWGIGTRTQWDVTKTFYLGVEALYENLHSATNAGTAGAGQGGTLVGYSQGSATGIQSNLGNWSFTLRAHRDFLP